jgi:hypothetical protein
MSETHIVQAGEYMEMIAEKYGFRDYHVIYDHANNAAFKTKRPNPHLLFPGDSVFIPDMDPGHEPADTDKKHKFVLKAQKIKFQVYIRRNGKPFANQAYKLKVGEQTITDRTGADGLIKKDIPVGEPLGLLTFTGPPAYTRKLNFGFLHPITTVSGRQMRLNNLGFVSGAPNGVESAAYAAALRAFQHKQGIAETGKADADTIDKLRTEYDHGVQS